MSNKFEKLKVYINKRNNQAFVVLPRKELSVIPKFIEMKKSGLFKKKR